MNTKSAATIFARLPRRVTIRFLYLTPKGNNKMTNYIEQIESDFIETNKLGIERIDTKTFYAYELAQEPLVNYLARTSDSDGSQVFDNVDLSVIFEKSLDIYNGGSMHSVEYFKRIEDWEFIAYSYFHEKSNTICLPVILSTNRIMEIKKQGKNNAYAIELALARYLYGKEANLAVIAIDRLFTNYKPMQTKLLNFIPIEDTYSNEEIDRMLRERIEALDKALESKTPPNRCTNLRWHNKGGVSIPMQCKHYCKYSHVCEHNKTKSKYKRVTNKLFF